MSHVIKFVGGPHEGEILVIPELVPYWRFLVLDGPQLYVDCEEIPPFVQTKVDLYERWKLGDDQYLYIYKGRQ